MGEVGGASTLAISLIYLTTQVRQNTRSMSAAEGRELTSRLDRTAEMLIVDPNVREIGQVATGDRFADANGYHDKPGIRIGAAAFW